MARVKSSSSSDTQNRIRPALSVENREMKLGSLAGDLAEKQLREGTAAPQIIHHYLEAVS